MLNFSQTTATRYSKQDNKNANYVQAYKALKIATDKIAELTKDIQAINARFGDMDNLVNAEPENIKALAIFRLTLINDKKTLTEKLPTLEAQVQRTKSIAN